MIYLAAPYWHEDPAVRKARVKSLCEFHAALLTSVAKSFYYNPLVNSIGAVNNTDENYWRHHGEHMVSLAQSVYVLCLPGWEASVGVKSEIAKAHEKNIPIHYFSPQFKQLPT